MTVFTTLEALQYSTMKHWGGIIFALLVLMTGLFAHAQPAATQSTTQSASVTAVVVDVDGDIDDYIHNELQRRFAKARSLGAHTVIVRINTYGGLVTSGLNISRFLKHQNDLNVIAYVNEKAISAGAMIAIACDEIVMEPNSLIGDCAPIVFGNGGLETLGETERAKSESPILQDFYDSAIQNGHNPLLLQSMVSLGRVVWWIENVQTGERRFVDQAEHDRLLSGDDPQWKLVDMPGVQQPIDSANSLFTASTDLAVKLGLASGKYHSVQEYAAAHGLNIVAELKSTAGDQAIRWLGSHALRSLLLTVFFVTLYMSLSTPGTGAPEIIASICIILLLGIPMMSGQGQWYEVLMVLGGLMLIAVELFVLPGFGVAGISGIILIFTGLTLSFLPPLMVPGLPFGAGVSMNRILNALLSVSGAMVASILLWWWLSRYLVTLPYFGKLVLAGANDTTGRAPAGDAARIAVDWPTVGAVGRAITRLAPGGTAEFIDDATGDTRPADVVCDGGYVDAGSSVIVREVHGNRIVVRPTSSPQEGAI